VVMVEAVPALCEAAASGVIADSGVISVSG
jgi:hypothetical protein